VIPFRPDGKGGTTLLAIWLDYGVRSRSAHACPCHHLVEMSGVVMRWPSLG
jgi:hypothetical protein